MRLLDLFRKADKPAPKRRAFEAASTGRLFSDWLTQTKSADHELRYTLKAMRARSRDLTINNDYAARFLDMVSTNVVGAKGIQLQVRGREPDGRLDQYGNSMLEDSFRAWGQMEFCTVDGTMTWLDAQRMFIESVARDGEAFVLLVTDSSNPWRFRLQFIDPDRVDVEYNGPAGNGNEIRMGVEIDKAGKPLAYYVDQKHPDDYQFAAGYGVQRQRIPAESVIHAFRKRRPGQTRGYPWTATAMTRLKMLGGYEEAELVAARISSAKMGFFTSPEGDAYIGDGTDEQGQIRMDVTPGTFEQLPAGVDFKAFDPQHPSTAFAAFEAAMLRGIASGLGVSYTSLSNNLEAVSYSSIRQGLLEERDHWRTIQSWMVDHFCQPVFRVWLRQTLDGGVVNLPAAKYTKFVNAQWVPRGWQWVDPRNEAEAQITAINNGLMTMTQALAERGLDLEDVLRERQQETELQAAYGLTGGPADAVASD
jgi:lambda family phage portal protein